MSTFFEAIDLFDKISDSEDYTKESKSGKLLSRILTYLGIILLLFEISNYFIPKYVRELSIQNKSRDETKFVNISLTILVNLPCFFLHLDSLDSLGYNQLNINTTASLIRVSHDGHEINRTKYSLDDVCQPCHGLLPEGYCCNSCEKLFMLSAYMQKIPTPQLWPQCQNRLSNLTKEELKKKEIGDRKKLMGDPNEKCLIKGKISVNKISGSFHIAPGRNVKQFSGHLHDTNYNFPHFDLSHTISRLRFGPKIPKASNPLDGIRVIQRVDLPTFYKYNMIVAPIKYYKNGNFVTKSFEYSVMTSALPVGFLNRGFVPGIFFSYSFTPYTITVYGFSPSLISTISSTAGMLSGLFAIFSLVDTFMNNMKNVEEKEPEMEDQEDKNI